MVSSYLQSILYSAKLRWLVGIGFLVQCVFCIVAVGFFHPDQHFQILEFSSYQLHRPNAATAVWELQSNIRPTVQVSLLSGYRLACEAVGIANPFTQLTLLRLLQGLGFFLLYNWMLLHYCRQQPQRVLVIALILLNFSWFLPYSRTLYSAEVLGAMLFFPALAWLQLRLEAGRVGTLLAILLGFVMAISFFVRFQLAFAMIGLGFWLLFIQKAYRTILLLSTGFVAGVALNVWLDTAFYHKLVFTPYLYFKVNLLDGVAASFGEQGAWYYPAVLTAFIGAPFISVVLLWQYFRVSFQQWKQPLVLSTLLFLLGLTLVGHKEERFVFTIINVLPIILAMHPNAFGYLSSGYRWRKWIRPVVWFSVALNALLLVMFMLIPYCQTLSFGSVLNRQFAGAANTTLHCFRRNPLQTESHLPLTFYANGLQQLQLVNDHNFDSLGNLPDKPQWLCATFNDIKDHFGAADSLGYRPVAYSSTVLWHINEFLLQQKINTINDIWVLYQLKK